MAARVTSRPLGDLLEALAEGEIRSAAELAVRLGLSRDELETLLHHLAALGLVARRTAPSPGPCPVAGPSPACSACPGAPRCPVAPACGPGATPALRAWVLTERGRSLARARLSGRDGQPAG